MLYLYIKAFHIIAAVAWFAGLFYLPRLFVYHAECKDEAGRARFCTMERRLYRVIMGPAMAATLILGLSLVTRAHLGGWLAVKLGAVALLVVYHLRCGKYVKDFAANRPAPSPKFFRLFNEVPTLLLIIIVIMAVARPF